MTSFSWVLWVFIVGGVSGSSQHSAMYRDEAACEEAAVKIKAAMPRFKDNVYTVCTRVSK